ncbi:MAG: transporter substrate-binding domain-containing protein [Syntrophomonas sp.]|nr:transporter substrate-binding domain-containing protein [Syntrophomonas sp.]
MRKFLSLALCATLLMGLFTFAAGCQSSGSSDKTNPPASQEQLKVGMECDYPPFNWTQTTDANGAVPIAGGKEFAGGYDVEIAKLLAAGMGKELVIVKTAWAGLPPAVQSGNIDAIIAGMSPTAERKQTIDFSDHYYRSDLVLVVQKGSKFENATSLQELAGAKVTAQLNTFHYTVIEQIPNVVKKTAMDDFPAMRVALESGIIDAYVSEKPEGVSATAANPKFAMVEFAPGKGFQASDDDVAIAVGIKKGSTELATGINKVLSGLSEDQRKALMDQAIKNQPASN